jgi:hypothetical protein
LCGPSLDSKARVVPPFGGFDPICINAINAVLVLPELSDEEKHMVTRLRDGPCARAPAPLFTTTRITTSSTTHYGTRAGRMPALVAVPGGGGGGGAGGGGGGAGAGAEEQEVAQVQEVAVAQEQEVRRWRRRRCRRRPRWLVHVFIHSLLCARATTRANPSTKGRRPSK